MFRTYWSNDSFESIVTPRLFRFDDSSICAPAMATDRSSIVASRWPVPRRMASDLSRLRKRPFSWNQRWTISEISRVDSIAFWMLERSSEMNSACRRHVGGAWIRNPRSPQQPGRRRVRKSLDRVPIPVARQTRNIYALRTTNPELHELFTLSDIGSDPVQVCRMCIPDDAGLYRDPKHRNRLIYPRQRGVWHAFCR